MSIGTVSACSQNHTLDMSIRICIYIHNCDLSHQSNSSHKASLHIPIRCSSGVDEVGTGYDEHYSGKHYSALDRKARSDTVGMVNE